MPRTVMKPTRDPKERTPPLRKAPTTPPIKAKGKLSTTNVTKRHERKSINSSMIMPNNEMAASQPSRSRAASRTAYSPSNSGWYPWAKAIVFNRFSISFATLPRSVPTTSSVTSRRREAFSCLISLGVGTICRSANSPSGTRAPEGVSIIAVRSAHISWRMRSAPHTVTSTTFWSR